MNSSTPRPITLEDIGRRLNLSKRAVSQALSDCDSTVKISPATRERVRQLATELGYRHNLAARALRTGRTGLFGILSHYSPSQVMHKHLTEVVRAFERQGLTPIILQPVSAEQAAVQNAMDTLADARVDGALLLHHTRTVNAGMIRSWQQGGRKLVVIGARPVRGITSFVLRREQGYALAVHHIIDKGYRDIALLPTRSRAHDLIDVANRVVAEYRRRRGYGDLRLCTLDYDPAEVVPPDSPVNELHQFGYHAGMHIMQSAHRPQALVCAVDSIAMGVLRACTECGVRVPQDMVITGHGNEPTASAGAIPLTTLEAPVRQAADDAVEYLVRACRDPGSKRPRNRNYDFHLIERLSTQG